MKKIYFILAFMCLATVSVAQSRYINDVVVENLSGKVSDDQLRIDFSVRFDHLKLSPNDMLVLTPILCANNGTESRIFEPIVMVGKTRDKVILRNQRLKNEVPLPEHYQTVLVRKNGAQQEFQSHVALPFEEWMKDAHLKVQGEVRGCADCRQDLGDVLVSKRLIREPYDPQYKLSFIVPEVEPIKVRTDRHSASFNYVLDDHQLIRSYKNNASELDKVDKVISEVKSNKDITISKFEVLGYASPEGDYIYNENLASRRANSFADYLNATHRVTRNMLVVKGIGEDWKGLEEMVRNSSLDKKGGILDVIAMVHNPDARDAKLIALDGGATYNKLLREYYPMLRRTDYVIEFSVRPFNVEEAKDVIKKNPKLLSLNEMYLVAKTYPTDSDNFKNVFEVAVQAFPNDPIAIVNSAAMDIEAGKVQQAHERMLRIESDSRVWNNLAVTYSKKGEYDKAKFYFEKALANGDEYASYNLSELEKVLAD